MRAHGYPVPALDFGSLEGYLRGFIDLLFEHDGRAVAEGRVVAVRCLMRPGARLQAVAIPEDIIARLTASDAGLEKHRPDSTP
jgi:hypothetical protein